MNEPPRSELDKLLRTVRWIIIGLVVVLIFPFVAEFIVVLIGSMGE